MQSNNQCHITYEITDYIELLRMLYNEGRMMI